MGGKTLSTEPLSRMQRDVFARRETNSFPTASNSRLFNLLSSVRQEYSGDLMFEQISLPGEIIFEENELGDAMYVVLAGTIAIVRGDLQSPVLVAYRGAGEVIGEMSLVEDQPRVASGVAVEETHLLRISKECFRELLGRIPQLGLELTRMLSARLRSADETRFQPSTQDNLLYDSLTGVYNRATFSVRYQEIVAEGIRYGHPFSLLVIDLDYFKSINDGFGHARGDEVLVEFGRRLRNAIRLVDLPFRYGGDEFTLLLPDTMKAGAVILAERLLSDMRTQAIPGKPELTISLSIGVASFPEDGQTGEGLFKAADQRVYQAKRAGRGCAVSEDQSKAEPYSTLEMSRLIERDRALEYAHRFLDHLSDSSLHVLRVGGPAKCGQTRFLAEVAMMAKLRNLAVYAVCAAREHTFGVLADAQQAWLRLAVEAENPAQFARRVQHLAQSSNQGGVIFIVEDPCQVEQLGWISDGTLSKVGLVYADVVDDEPGGMAFLSGLPKAEIELTPLSLDGVRTWLRYTLHWEPPADFIQGLYVETGGLPGKLQERLAELVKDGMLESVNGDWVYHPART